MSETMDKWQSVRQRNAEGKHWRVRLICCGRDDGDFLAETWEGAESFRESYTSGYAVDEHGYSGSGWGHKRAGIIERIDSDKG